MIFLYDSCNPRTLKTFANCPCLLSFRRRSESIGNVYAAWIPTYVGMTNAICKSPNSLKSINLRSAEQ